MVRSTMPMPCNTAARMTPTITNNAAPTKGISTIVPPFPEAGDWTPTGGSRDACCNSARLDVASPTMCPCVAT